MIMNKFWIILVIFCLLSVLAYAILTVDVIPQADKNYDLGNTTHRYGIAYLYNVSLGNTTATYVMIYYNGTHLVIDT